MQEALHAFDAFKKQFALAKTSKALLDCAPALNKTKACLAKMNCLTPQTASMGGVSVDPKAYLLAREVLEVAAQWSIQCRDVAAFERTLAPLQAFYFDLASTLPPSQRMYPLLGLNLLRLLAQNRIADFHKQLELIDGEQLLENMYIRHPVQLEQWIMEGRYNKVWAARSEAPAEEYLVLMDMLLETIRNEIADCSEKSYESLPIQSATSLLNLANSNDLITFAKQRNWTVNAAEKKIYFKSAAGTHAPKLPASKLIDQFLNYALELERIV